MEKNSCHLIQDRKLFVKRASFNQMQEKQKAVNMANNIVLGPILAETTKTGEERTTMHNV